MLTLEQVINPSPGISLISDAGNVGVFVSFDPIQDGVKVDHVNYCGRSWYTKVYARGRLSLVN